MIVPGYNSPFKERIIPDLDGFGAMSVPIISLRTSRPLLSRYASECNS